MFYHFSQNNSGGSFPFSEEEGITHHVIIEADNASEANTIAELIGIYFDGCSTGKDCECCGDRWYSVYEYDEEEFPHVYGGKLVKPKILFFTVGWNPEKKFVFTTKMVVRSGFNAPDQRNVEEDGL